MDTLTVEHIGRGVYRVSYNGLHSRPVPYWRVAYYKRRVMNIYHRRWGRGR